MAKVLSIEIGNSLTKVCEVDYKTKNPKVYGSFTIATPEGAIEDGFIHDPESLGAAIREAIQQNGMKTKQVVYSIASSKIANRDATLPFVKENKLGELVEVSAPDYFPVDISDCKVAYQVTDIVEQEGKKQYKLSIMTAPNEMLESYYTLSEMIGLSVVALDYSGNSLVSVVKEVFKEGTQMVIKINGRSSMLTIFDEGNMVLQRTVPYGGDSAVETIIEEEERDSGKRVSYSVVTELLRKKPCIRKTLDPDQEEDNDEGDEQTKQFRLQITESVSMLANAILRVVDYYNSRNSEKPLQNIYLTGYAENFMGLTEFMSNELGLPVEKLSDLKTMTAGSDLRNSGEYIACIGATIAPMDFIPDAHNEKKKKKSKTGEAGTGSEVPKDASHIAYLICGGCALIAIVLAVISILPYMSASSENKELKAKEAELAPIELIYAEYQDALSKNTDVKIMYEGTRRQNDNLVVFLEELEAKLPSSTNVLSFTCDDDSVEINMNVESMEAAALTVMELRKFDSIATANIASTTKEFDENDIEISVNFTVDCTYAPLEYEVNGATMIPVE